MRSIVHATFFAFLLPVACFAFVEADTSNHKATGFSTGKLTPFVACTTQRPAFVKPSTLNGSKCAKLYWTQNGHDDIRLMISSITLASP